MLNDADPMDAVALRPGGKAELAAVVGRLWESAHGAPAGTVCIIVGADSLAVLIKNVLSPAEQTAARLAEGHALIQSYAEQLVVSLAPELKVLIESCAGRRVTSVSAHADTVAGHVLCFFILSEALPCPDPSGMRSDG